jgi:hypothetical protein
MQVNNSFSGLPAHILQALSGDFHALNTVTAPAPIKARAPLTRAPVTVHIVSDIADSEPHELECIALNDLTSFDILE